MWSKDFVLSGILSEVLSDEDCVRRVSIKSQMFLIMSRILFQKVLAGEAKLPGKVNPREEMPPPPRK